jgi:hypothetical protein
MGVLKGLGTGILSFLLFISLSVWGSAFLINSTVLNPAFVAGQVNKLDVTAVARDIIDDQISQELTDEPDEVEFIAEAVYAVVAEQEPWLKEQADNAVYEGYDFLLGKSDRLEIIVPLESLKADFKESLWETLKKFLRQNASKIPEDLLVPYIMDYYQELVGSIPEFLLPPGMAGLMGNELESYLHQNYDQVTDILQKALLVPGVSDLIMSQIRPYFDEYYDDFVRDIPSEQVYNEEEIPADIMEQLWLAREYIGYFKTGYYALIAFMLLLVAGIILINRNVKDSTRALGIVLTVYGVWELAGVIISRSINWLTSLPEDLPAALVPWLDGLIKDSLAPLLWFSLGVLIIGVALLVLSFVYRSPATED